MRCLGITRWVVGVVCCFVLVVFIAGMIGSLALAQSGNGGEGMVNYVSGAYGDCTNPTTEEESDCEGEEGGCHLDGNTGEDYGIGDCYDFDDLDWGQGEAMPNGQTAHSARATSLKAYGNCEDGDTEDECEECEWFYCAEAQFWPTNDCSGDEGPWTYAIATGGVCDSAAE